MDTLEKESARKRWIRTLVVMLVGGWTSSAAANVIGYWTFDGSAGDFPPTLATEVNSPALDGSGTYYGAASSTPRYDMLVPGTGPVITDGIGGPTVNPANATSLQFFNRDVPANTNSALGSVVTVTDPGGAGSLLKPDSFTAEAFVKRDVFVNFSCIFSKSRVDGNGSSWMIDTDGSGHIRARFDTQPLGTNVSYGGGVYNQSFTTAASLIDDAWHHVALTYDGGTRAATLYFDYMPVRTGTVASALVYDDSLLRIGQGGGGRAFDGWIDEARLSDTVLASDEFLQAVPEPSTLGLLGIAFVLGARRRFLRPS